MRIARYERDGRPTYGFVVGDRVIDHESVPGADAATVRAFIDAGSSPSLDAATDPGVPLAEVALLPPVELDKVVCAGVNFPTHREEAHLKDDKPAHPVIFTRFADSHVGDGGQLIKPEQSEMFDYEGELAVVIGKTAWRVSADDALDHVFGYSCYNDGSVRDWQFHTNQWAPGKNFFRSGSIGPWIVTADEVGDIGESWLTTKVDGEVRQRAQIKDMVHSIRELIAYVSTFTPLHPGDVIAAGTPGGVGLFMEPKGLLVDGQTVEVEIDRVGVLRNRVAHEAASPESLEREAVDVRAG